MKLSRRSKFLKASSIVESIIAIVLISICSLVSFYIYINVIKQKQPLTFFKAKHQIQIIALKSEKNQDFESEVFTFDDYSIEKDVLIKETKNLVELIFTIKTRNKSYKIKKLAKLENQ